MTTLTLDLILQNRRHLNSIPEWLQSDSYRSSRFNYGVPPHLQPLLNLPLDDTPTYTDVLTAVALAFNRPVRYLEIGASVGKNFYCQVKALTNSILVALDWEEPNPLFNTVFTPVPPATETFRSYVSESNRIHYVKGDEFDQATWEQLDGHQFDVILSDAAHSPAALLFEYAMLSRFNLLNPHGCFVMWDDLRSLAEHPMNRAFTTICGEMRTTFGDAVQTGVLTLNGWIGQYEPAHFVGFATTLPITKKSLSDAVDTCQRAASR